MRTPTPPLTQRNRRETYQEETRLSKTVRKKCDLYGQIARHGERAREYARKRERTREDARDGEKPKHPPKHLRTPYYVILLHKRAIVKYDGETISRESAREREKTREMARNGETVHQSHSIKKTP